MGKTLSASDRGKIGALVKAPQKLVNAETGEWRAKPVETLNALANKMLGVHRGRTADGYLREVTPHEERPVSHEYCEGLSTDPKSLASHSKHRPHKAKALRVSTTGVAEAEHQPGRAQLALMARLESADPDVKDAAQVEAREQLTERVAQERADIDAALASQGVLEDSLARRGFEYDPDWDDEDEADDDQAGIYPEEFDDGEWSEPPMPRAVLGWPDSDR